MKTKKSTSNKLTIALSAAVLAASAGSLSCEAQKDDRVFMKFTEGRTFAGGIDVSAHELQQGHDAYMLYCYACHGENGDGHGPSSYGLRPPPRDFTKGIFKFARLRSSDELPNDEDLVRIVHGGLHGTAMLPWDIPEVELVKIIQYVKTFAPDKWEKTKKNGDPVPTLDPFEAPADPWIADDEGAWKYGRDLYHFRAECVNCHPSYGTKKELYELSVAAAKRDPDKFKPIGGFRDDPYQPVAKDSAEYNQRILPPDFTFNNVRSVRPGTELEDLFRLISFGVYPIMPAWKGAGLTDKDIWALSHYVKHLIDMKGTKELDELRDAEEKQAPFVVPKAEEEKKPAAEPEKKEETGEAEKKEEPKAEEKPAPEKAEAPKPPAKAAPAKAAPAKAAPAKAPAKPGPAKKGGTKKGDDVY